MISRQWACVFKREYAEEYVQHLKEDLFPKLAAMQGFRGASVMRRENAQAVEFLIMTNWESMEAIKQFAGDIPHLAVVPEEVQLMTVSYDKEVRHYEVVYSDQTN